MLTMDAVVPHGFDETFDLWPATLADGDPWDETYLYGGEVVLSGEASDAEVGTVVVMWAQYRHDERDEAALRSVWTPHEYLRRALGKEWSPDHVTDGGPRLRDDDSGVTIAPGCCCGLESWRSWLELLDGGRPVLGHAPVPRVEHDGPLVRMWPDDRDRTGPSLLLPVADLPGLLRSVHRDLRGFLPLVERWAVGHVPDLASALVAEMDATLRIREPLPW
ncbi:hypothetical protein ACFXKD_07415 [Nocardiopsis aegyptia]|uniref:hypothetical protein n=1 Tax=Nocardiopsis aegyptia TaxID=220378 RepID=UPI00366BEB3D